MGSGYGYGNAVKIDSIGNGFVRGMHTCKLKIPESFGIGDPAVLLLETRNQKDFKIRKQKLIDPSSPLRGKCRLEEVGRSTGFRLLLANRIC